MGGKGSGRTPYKRFTAAADTTVVRPWPVRNPACVDRELQDEAVTALQRLHDVILAELVVAGKPNPLLDELEHLEAVCIANGVILRTRQSGKSLIRMIAEGCLNA